ncbi:MAG: replicative DNA helicase [Armatimonadota bacterium]|nr:replicative DNA helicase [Armatimonadota bacterium]
MQDPVTRTTPMDRGGLDRVPPQNIEAEQSTLGSMMLDRAAIEKAGEILRQEDFYRTAHQVIYDALWSLAERDEAVDLITIQEEMRRRGKLEAVGGTEYLMALLDSVPTAANVEYYAKIVEEKSIRRRLIEAATEVIGYAHSQDEDIDALADRAEQIVFAVAQRRLGRSFSPLATLVSEAWDTIERRYQEGKAISGLETGFEALDYMTSGLQPSDLVIIAGRPSMGKTALALNIATHAAIRKKMPVAIFSVEMSSEQLALRMLCSQAHMDSHRLRSGRIHDTEWKPLGEATEILSQAPIFIDDSSDITPMAMRAKCRRLRAEHGLGMVVVDYLQLVRWHRTIENRVQEISEIARSLKGLARELKVPVVVGSQLSRAVERREEHRPMLSDLRESGSIEAEADVVAMIYRESYYKHKEGREQGETVDDDIHAVDEAEIIIAKQRNGPTGTVRLAFLPQYACFQNLERDRTE